MKLEDATQPQREAITTTAKTVLVVAGPGSGKTATTVARISHLIDNGADPRGIVVITFTNAAAREIEKRLVALIGQHNVSLGYVGTLHGFALRMLKQHGRQFGYGDRMSIISPESAEDLLQSKATALNCKLKMKELHKLKAAGRPPRGTRLDVPASVIASYYDDLAQAGIVDFDILLTEFARFVEGPETDPWNNDWCDYTHLFVDEVQDSAPIDWEIYHALPINNKFYVGDPDQAIYGFRGGDINGMMWLAKRDGTHLIKLEENFRSNSEICESAQHLIEHNRNRVDKATISHKGLGGQVTARPPAMTEGEEIGTVTRAILEMLASFAESPGTTQPPEIAVLCRTNAMAYAAQKTLAAAGVPVVQRAPSDQPKDWPLLRAYMELLVNPDNDTLAHFYLIAAYEARGHTPKEAREMAHDNQRSAAAARKSINGTTLGIIPPTTAASAMGMAVIHKFTMESRMLLSEIVREVGPESTPLELALALGTHRGENVKEEPGTGIHVMTIHASKGREFDAVFLLGWEEEIMPGRAKIPEDIEEERRLAYVALTRARHFAMITSSATRTTPWGAINSHNPSRFIAELTA